LTLSAHSGLAERNKSAGAPEMIWPAKLFDEPD
jgi:hypothetical protein